MSAVYSRSELLPLVDLNSNGSLVMLGPGLRPNVFKEPTTDLKCAVIDNNPVVRITTDDGIHGLAG